MGCIHTTAGNVDSTDKFEQQKEAKPINDPSTPIENDINNAPTPHANSDSNSSIVTSNSTIVERIMDVLDQQNDEEQKTNNKPNKKQIEEILQELTNDNNDHDEYNENIPLNDTETKSNEKNNTKRKKTQTLPNNKKSKKKQNIKKQNDKEPTGNVKKKQNIKKQNHKNSNGNVKKKQIDKIKPKTTTTKQKTKPKAKSKPSKMDGKIEPERVRSKTVNQTLTSKNKLKSKQSSHKKKSKPKPNNETQTEPKSKSKRKKNSKKELKAIAKPKPKPKPWDNWNIDGNDSDENKNENEKELKINNKKQSKPWDNWEIDSQTDNKPRRKQRRSSLASVRELARKRIEKSKKPKKIKTQKDVFSENELEQINSKKTVKGKKKKKKSSKKKNNNNKINNPAENEHNKPIELKETKPKFPWENWEIDNETDNKSKRNQRRSSLGSVRELARKHIEKQKHKKMKTPAQKDVFSENELEQMNSKKVKSKKKKKSYNKKKNNNNNNNVDIYSPKSLKSDRKKEKKRKKYKVIPKHHIRRSSLPTYDSAKKKLALISKESKRDLSQLLDQPEKRKMSKRLKNLSRNGFEIHINKRYKLFDGRVGICKYKGRTEFGKSSEDWIGLLIEIGNGEHNGSVKGKLYFRCRDGKGLFVRPYDIVKDMGSKNKMLSKNDIKLAKQDIKRYKETNMITSDNVINNDIEGNAINPDHGYNMLNEKYFNSKTMLDKNKGQKVGKKKRHFEV